jgi:OOP family OmpA-OmpF porin
MKKTIITYLFFVLTLKLVAQQNLVLNPSFENMITCPDAGFTDIGSSANWYNPTGATPDYYNSCATDIVYGFSVPKNGLGYQSAVSGFAYAGIVTMVQNDSREYIQTALTDTLVAGKSYTVKFYVSIADSCKYSANNIGAYFSVNPVLAINNLFLPFTPQISNNALVNPLDDRNSWVEVTGSFIAQGGEKYLTIGNFNDDLNTDTTLYIDGSTWIIGSYHYVDDVSVMETFPSSVNEVTSESQVSVYLNSSIDILFVKSSKVIESITIYSNLGQLILRDNSQSYSYQINSHRFPNGVYYININTTSSIITKKIIINH